MLRRVSVCLAVSLLMFAPGCKKESGEVEGDAASKAGEGDKQPEVAQPTPTPTPTPTDPVAPTDSGGAAAGDSGAGGSGGGVGGSGGGAAKPRGEDLTCDPLDRGACLEGEQCLGGQGCDAVWSCDAEVVCKKGVKEYCGCDGRTFEAVYGNCPWKKYQYEGPCK